MMSLSIKDASPRYVTQPPARTHQPPPVILTSSLPSSLLPFLPRRAAISLVACGFAAAARRRVALRCGGFAASEPESSRVAAPARNAVLLLVTMSTVTMTRRASSFRDRMAPSLILATATVIFATGHALKLGEPISSFPHFFTRGALMPFVAFYFATCSVSYSERIITHRQFTAECVYYIVFIRHCDELFAVVHSALLLTGDMTIFIALISRRGLPRLSPTTMTNVTCMCKD